MKKEHYHVNGMSCAACQAHVDKAVRNTNGVINCNVNLLTNSMDVEYDESICSSDEIKQSVKEAGYSACLMQDKNSINKSDHSLVKLIISSILMIVLMYVSMGHMINENIVPPLFRLPTMDNGLPLYYSIIYFLIQFALTIPVCIIYRHYFIDGFKRLFKAPNMNTLIALGATSSLVYDVFAFVMVIIAVNNQDHSQIMKYHHQVYFDSVVMILTFVSLGKYFEEVSKRKTTKAIEALVDLSPKTARLANTNEIIEVKDIKTGDLVLVKIGEVIPVDGIIIDGEGSIEESTITGESLPVYKKENNEVYASTILKSGYLIIQASKNGEDSSFNTIIRLVEEASSSKAPISRLVDKISLYFVPIIILIALITFGIHLGIQLANHSSTAFETSFNYGVSVLVVACPCALGLATPVSIMVASGKGARLGLIVRNAEILQKAGEINVVVLDKTGTLTMGKPVVTDLLILENKDEVLTIINSIEKLSHHPLAEAINNYAAEKRLGIVSVNDFEMIEGKGVKGSYKGDVYLLGNNTLTEGLIIPEEIKKLYDISIRLGKTSLFIIKNNQVIGLVAIRDNLRESSIEAIDVLKQNSVEIVMLTGDKKETATAIANELKIDKVIAEVLPIDKSNVILSLKGDKKTVAMIGDGVNDTLALTNADVGIAMGGGSDAAIKNSDVILIKKDLRDVYNMIRLSKRTMTTIKVALFWAFFYNCIGVVLASGIVPNITLNPMICSLAMSFSSVFVVLTALSINLFKKK